MEGVIFLFNGKVTPRNNIPDGENMTPETKSNSFAALVSFIYKRWL
jgi:hypothetical protein